MMTVREMVRGLVRAAEFKEQQDEGRIWDDECRRALEAARERGWGLNRIGRLVDSSVMRVEMEKLRELAERAMKLSVAPGEVPHPWELQTSNSFRRIGTSRGDGDVLCAIKQRPDGHPDLYATAGVLDYIVAAQPRAVLALLADIEELERYIVEATDREGLYKARVAQALMDYADKLQRDVMELLKKAESEGLECVFRSLLDYVDKVRGDVLELLNSQIDQIMDKQEKA